MGWVIIILMLPITVFLTLITNRNFIEYRMAKRQATKAIEKQLNGGNQQHKKKKKKR